MEPSVSKVGALGLLELTAHDRHCTSRQSEIVRAERLLEPVGMMTSHFGGPASGARVSGTEPATIGEGGLWTTPVDLERWNEAMNARAFGTTAHDLAETSGRLRDGSFMANTWGERRPRHRWGSSQLVHDPAL